MQQNKNKATLQLDTFLFRRLSIVHFHDSAENRPFRRLDEIIHQSSPCVRHTTHVLVLLLTHPRCCPIFSSQTFPLFFSTFPLFLFLLLLPPPPLSLLLLLLTLSDRGSASQLQPHNMAAKLYNFKSITVVPKASEFVDIVLSKTQRKTPTVVHK